MENTLPTERMSELRFRELAELCAECGICKIETAHGLCEPCWQKKEIEKMQAQWREWGIAA
jgi:hypothetical protein